jgi:hypothetical protein
MIRDRLHDRYKVSLGVLTDDVDTLLGELVSAGLVTSENERDQS